MITEDYCSFEVAKLLKEKGFDKFSYYGWDEQLFDKEHPRNFSIGIDDKKQWISCHTHQMAMKWLRKMYKIYIDISPTYSEVEKTIHFIWQIFDSNYDDIGDCDIFYPSYEEAVETALKYCLENLI